MALRAAGLFPAAFAAGGRRRPHADRGRRGGCGDRVQQRVAALRVGDPAVFRARRSQPAHPRPQPPGPDRSSACAGRLSRGAAGAGRGDRSGRAVAHHRRACPCPATGRPATCRRRHRPPHRLVRLRPRRPCRSLCEVLHGVPEIRRHAANGSADRQHVLQPAGQSRGVLAREASRYRVWRTGCPAPRATSPRRTTSRSQTACGGSRIVCRRSACCGDIRSASAARLAFEPRSSGGPSPGPPSRSRVRPAGTPARPTWSSAPGRRS